MGKRAGVFLGAVLFLLPATAQAQKKPGSNLWIRSAELYISRGYQQNNPDDRQRFFNEALQQSLLSTQKQPDNARGWQLAGQALVALGQIERADSMLDKAEALYPPFAEADDTVREQTWVGRYNAAVRALRANQTDSAIANLRLADLIYQGRPAARMTLASLYLNKGDYDQAAHYYQGALEILNGPEAKNLPAANVQQWKEDKAKVQTVLGQLYMATKKYDEAVRFYRQEVSATPDDAGLKISLARALELDAKPDSATALFKQLAATSGLTDQQYVEVGVALFRVHDFATASTAFRQATTVNPLNHGALYNLAQSLLAEAQPVEQAREQAAPAARKPFAEKLAPVFAELKDVTNRFLVLEPANSVALRLASATSRGEANIASDSATEKADRLAALALLERTDSLTFDVGDTNITQSGDTSTVSGTITNRKLDAGTPARLTVTFLGKGGATLDTQDVSVPAPQKEQTANFKATSTAKNVVSWKYEVVK